MRAVIFVRALICLAASAGSALVAGEPLAGTKLLTADGDLAAQMVAGIDRFLLDRTDASRAARARHWQRDTSSAAAYEKSVAKNRERLKKYLGVVDARVEFAGLELLATTDQPARIASGPGFEVIRVRWPVVREITAEGLLVRPLQGPATADIVALPDADWTPEMLLGLVPGVPAESQFARALAAARCRVLIPTLINRADTHSEVIGQRKTNQPHREFVYRGAYEMGRHVIGYEVQKVLAAVDWLARESGGKDPQVGVIGYGEGGLLALYAGAVDPRIDVTCTSGYFEPREGLWQEPIYRNVWSLLDEFGDAELASLIAPRSLVVEASRVPEVTGPPPERNGRRGAAPGRLQTPPLVNVQAEFDRAKGLVSGLEPAPQFVLVADQNGTGAPGSRAALEQMLMLLAGRKGAAALPAELAAIELEAPLGDADARQQRQFAQLIEDVQFVMRQSEFTRREFWSKADASSLEAWRKSTQSYRDYFYDEVIGRIDEQPLPPNPRTRQVYDQPKYRGFEVMLDVWPGVYAYGILLLPKDLKSGEKRPVVVCQHGLEGRPQDVADPEQQNRAYHQYACRLAERGFVVYAPQNPYIGRDLFRTLQRKANPLKSSLFSVIVPQHQVTTDWLAGLPFVDAERIGFYGLSYGGKTAMRVPALVDRYALSICSADFNEWIWKNVSNRHRYSYLGTGEYEMFEFDLGNTFNYAEMASLIAPRPFMVERGHHDGVAPDEWVAYEFARVRRQYAALGIADRAEIEFFDGPHTIHGVGTFSFLHRQLGRPEPERP